MVPSFGGRCGSTMAVHMHHLLKNKFKNKNYAGAPGTTPNILNERKPLGYQTSTVFDLTSVYLCQKVPYICDI